MNIYETIKSKQMIARKNKDTFLATCLGGILNEVKPVGNTNFEITDEIVVKALNKYIKNVETNIEMAQKSGRTELIENFIKEKNIYEICLPKQMVEEEIKNIIETIIDNREKNMKMMGEIIGKFNKEYSGQFNPSILSKLVKESLN
jgi:uncharacterized protein